VKDVNSKKPMLMGMKTHKFGSLTVSMVTKAQRMKQILSVGVCLLFGSKH